MPQSNAEIWWQLFDARTPDEVREAVKVVAERYGLREDAVKTERTGGGLLVGPIPPPNMRAALTTE